MKIAPDGSGSKVSATSSGKSSGGPRSRQVVLKKGPWTAAEDAILVEYVQKHGEGNWNAVQRNSGLMRCGKSCRLRWANHLRPNLKKGAFSADEERLIIELHAQLGNKWARMASQLPGRTDNEIKNYWNTRMKKRQRAGFPVYPPDIQILKNHHHYQSQQPNNSSFSSPFPSSSQHRKPNNYTPPVSIFDHVSLSSNTVNPHNQQQHPLNPSLLTNSSSTHRFTLLRNNNRNLALSPFSNISPLSLPLPWFNQSFQSELMSSTPSFQFNSPANFSSNDPRPNNIGDSILTAIELPSIQSSVPLSTNTPTSSSENMMTAAAASSTDVDEIVPELWWGNGGLLEDLLAQSNALSTRPDNCKQINMSAEEHKVEEKCDQKKKDGSTEKTAGNEFAEEDQYLASVHGESVLMIDYGIGNPSRGNYHWEDLNLISSPNTVPVLNWHDADTSSNFSDGRLLNVNMNDENDHRQKLRQGLRFGHLPKQRTMTGPLVPAVRITCPAFTNL